MIIQEFLRRGVSMIDNNIPMHLNEYIQNEIKHDESIVWFAQPIPLLFMRRKLSVFLFGIVFFGFSIFMTFSAYEQANVSENNSNIVFLLFLLPFLIAGGALFFSPLYYYYLAKNTIYIITNKRGLLIQKGRLVTVKSFYSETIRYMKRELFANGSGNIIFDQKIVTDSDGDKQYTDIGFLCIRDVKKAEEILMKIED